MVLFCRGVYLACLFYHEERVLVTEEDKYIPLVEVDECMGAANVAADYTWFLKLTYQWDNLRQLSCDVERLAASSSSYSLLSRFISAALQMQVFTSSLR